MLWSIRMFRIRSRRLYTEVALQIDLFVVGGLCEFFVVLLCEFFTVTSSLPET